jgi:uncharacterized protein
MTRLSPLFPILTLLFLAVIGCRSVIAQDYIINLETPILDSQLFNSESTFQFPGPIKIEKFPDRISPKRVTLRSNEPLAQPSLTLGIQATEEQRYEDALEIFKLLADEDMADAYNKIGFFYVFGLSVEPNRDAAIYYFSEGAKRGSAKSINNLALLGVIGDQFLDARRNLYLDRKHSGGTVYVKLPQDKKQIRGNVLNHPDTKHSSICSAPVRLVDGLPFKGSWTFPARSIFSLFNPFELMVAHKASSIDPKNVCSEAFELLKIAANQGDVFALYNLGLSYRHGLGVKQDYEEAAKWFAMAVAKDFPDAFNALGIELYLGRGVDQDFAAAIEHFSYAAIGGVSNANYNLGIAYFEGRGVTKDKSIAYNLIRSAAQDGDLMAERALGYDKLPDSAGPKSLTEARQWLDEAFN